MKTKLIIGILLAGAVLTGGYALYRYFNRQTELLQDYGIDLLGIKFSSFSEDLITADFSFRVTNKADIEATVTRLYADIYLNDAYVGNVINSGEFLVPAKGSSDIKLQFSFASKEILKNIVSTFFSLLETHDIPYQLKGYVKIKSGFVPLSVPFEYNGKLKNDMLTAAVTPAK